MSDPVAEALRVAVEVVRDGQHADLDSAVAAGLIAFLTHNGVIGAQTLALAAAVERAAAREGRDG